MLEGRSAWHMTGALVGDVLRGVYIGGMVAAVPFVATMLLVQLAGVTPLAFAVPILITVLVAVSVTRSQLPGRDALLRVDVDRSPEPTRIGLVRPFRRSWSPIGEVRAVTIVERRIRPVGTHLAEAAPPADGEEPAEEGLPHSVEVTLTGPGGRTWTTSSVHSDLRVGLLDTVAGRAPTVVAEHLTAQFSTMLAGTPAVVRHERRWVELGELRTPAWFSGGSASANASGG
ncbi:hypothetical protein Acy02nite_82220 [Actinoplanes cyaneus]|uniref:Uncharacterized protein n=1 Tax=Actinoplanes cyaneus TaxID=52696 RepID=A0A919MGK6_9ACTN|nr:hypothetical protein [Actinoplanes cyaneus]MCW2143487.1 hypothetical protein [Actinoplanes cyaneus]GID70341.1 hypothetical protein Acy02nite_82220 [Actinoplanes cyaneus]